MVDIDSAHILYGADKEHILELGSLAIMKTWLITFQSYKRSNYKQVIELTQTKVDICSYNLNIS